MRDVFVHLKAFNQSILRKYLKKLHHNYTPDEKTSIPSELKQSYQSNLSITDKLNMIKVTHEI